MVPDALGPYVVDTRQCYLNFWATWPIDKSNFTLQCSNFITRVALGTIEPSYAECMSQRQTELCDWLRSMKRTKKLLIALEHKTLYLFVTLPIFFCCAVKMPNVMSFECKSWIPQQSIFSSSAWQKGIAGNHSTTIWQPAKQTNLSLALLLPLPCSFFRRKMEQQQQEAAAAAVVSLPPIKWQSCREKNKMNGHFRVRMDLMSHWFSSGQKFHCVCWAKIITDPLTANV